MTRQRGGTTRLHGEQLLPSSPAEIGRMLRETREQRGLDLVTIHDRLARPITQLEALESGDLRLLPDQAMALSTLRRYAAFLTLDGDMLALQLMEAWTTSPATTNRRRLRDSAGLADVMAAATNGPEHLRAFTQTGQVPRVGGASMPAANGVGAINFGDAAGHPTGMIPVVPLQVIKDARRSIARARRSRRAPTSLKLITWGVVVLLLATITGITIQNLRPQWMVEAHLLRFADSGGASSFSSGGSTNGQHHPSASAVTAGPTDGMTKATYTVAAQHFTLRITTSGSCWVQITSPDSIAPLSSGVLQPGEVQSFDANKSITVQLGAAAVVVNIIIKGKSVFSTAPQATPFTYTFTSNP